MAQYLWLVARGVSCALSSRNVPGFSKENCPVLPGQV